MLKSRVWMTWGCCLLAASGFASAQSRKAGLWEVTSKTTIQQPGSGTAAATGTASADQTADQPGGIPVCYSQAMVDTYGIVLPPSLRDCDIFNVVQTASRFTADMTCKGLYNGKGTIESTLTDPDHVVGKVQFASKPKDGAKQVSLHWVEDVSATFKGSDCGTVKPRPIPVK